MRSIPIQPSLDRFHKTNEKAPSIHDFYASSFFTADNHSSPTSPSNLEQPHGNDNTNDNRLLLLQCPFHLLSCSDNLESLRQFYGANIIINTKASDVYEYSHEGNIPTLLPHRLDLPKTTTTTTNRDMFNNLFHSLHNKDKLSNIIRSKSIPRIRTRARTLYEKSKHHDGKKDKTEKQSNNTLHITKAYFKVMTCDTGQEISSCKQPDDKIHNWLTHRKERWRNEYFYRNVSLSVP